MNFTPKTKPGGQLSLLGGHDRTENAPQVAASPSSQRWTTREQVEQLLAHPRIRDLWPEPTSDYVAADPCAGTGQLMRHIDDILLWPPEHWKAWEIDEALVTGSEKYDRWRGNASGGVYWACADAARLDVHVGVDIVATNLPWFGVFARIVGHWRSVAFPQAAIIALCDDQERTRKSAIDWMDAGNYPDIIAALPGRQSFDGADDGQYPFSCSWYVWLPGSRRTRADGSELIWL